MGCPKGVSKDQKSTEKWRKICGIRRATGMKI
jgi:hypothetical protein